VARRFLSHGRDDSAAQNAEADGDHRTSDRAVEAASGLGGSASARGDESVSIISAAAAAEKTREPPHRRNLSLVAELVSCALGGLSRARLQWSGMFGFKRSAGALALAVTIARARSLAFGSGARACAS
jgi:hypothetical protein